MVTKLQLFSLQKRFETTTTTTIRTKQITDGLVQLAQLPELKEIPFVFRLETRLLHPMVSLVSVVGVVFPGSNHFTAPVWNAAHQPPQLVLVQVDPLLLDSNEELSQAVGADCRSLTTL